MAVTAMFDHILPTDVQDEDALVMSLFTHKPPVTPAAQTFFLEASFGSNAMALVRPPTLFGPLSVHWFEVELPGAAVGNELLVSDLNIGQSLSGIGLPVSGSMVLK